jgi:hypothetical protein
MVRWSDDQRHRSPLAPRLFWSLGMPQSRILQLQYLLGTDMQVEKGRLVDDSRGDTHHSNHTRDTITY